jgi:hypothetical protein
VPVVGDRGQGERSHRVLVLAAHAQRRPARCEDHETRAGLEQPRQCDGGGEEVLEVVEDQQQVTVAQCVDHDLVGVEALDVGEAHGAADGGHHQVRVAEGGERHPGHAVAEVAAGCLGGGE